MVSAAVKERSPNYPSLSLEQAVEHARHFYEVHKRSSTPYAIAATALGFNTLSGPAKSRIGALKQYGIFDTDRQGFLRLSERGLTLALSSPASHDHLRALQAAALSPAIFGEIYRDKQEASDDTIRYYLQRERRFSEEGATRVIAAYRASIAHAKLSDGSSDDPETEDEDVFDGQDGAGGGGKPPAGQGSQIRWPFADGTVATLTFQGGAMTLRHVKTLRQLLAIQEQELQEMEVGTMGGTQPTPLSIPFDTDSSR